MLKQFTCVKCSSVDLLPGGSCNHLCNPCKMAEGRMPGRTPQQEAHLQVARAIRSGVLARPAGQICADCGAPAIEYDHRDYGKPLEVTPVCRRCNLRRGQAIGHAIVRQAA